jgi:hypothetical protein
MPATRLPLDVKSLRSAWGTPDFHRVLEGQLLSHWQKVPLEKACESGGRPDDPHFHNFRSSEPDHAALSISFETTFRETACPGCGSIAAEHIRFAEFTLTVTHEQCVIEYRDRQPEPEF